MGIKLMSQPIIENAVRISGLEDFGGDTYQGGLEALISSLNNDLDLAEGTAGYFQQVITQILINRLEVTRLIKDHPEIRDEEIKAPVVIVGLPNERWVLKAPIHLFGLAPLLKTYPDARIIFTHRDPLEAMVSGVSMVSHWTRCSTGQVNLKAIADWYPALWARGLERALAVRKSLKEEQVVDVFHSDLNRDPVGSMKKIYGHFHIPFTRTVQKRMQVWLRDNPRSTFGSHSCTASELGMNPDLEKERFGFYLNRYH